MNSVTRDRMARSLTIVAVTFLGGCTEPADEFIRRTDAKPTEERPANWDAIRQMMQRTAPRVGAVAPDFTLRTVDGSRAITRSKFHPDKPLVLVFGSFT